MDEKHYTQRTPLITRVFTAYKKEEQWYVKIPCIDCPLQLEIPINLENFERWIRKETLIQEAMPELNVDLREMFLSGICPDCWDATFK
jgi:hypothetical protein